MDVIKTSEEKRKRKRKWKVMEIELIEICSILNVYCGFDQIVTIRRKSNRWYFKSRCRYRERGKGKREYGEPEVSSEYICCPHLCTESLLHVREGGEGVVYNAVNGPGLMGSGGRQITANPGLASARICQRPPLTALHTRLTQTLCWNEWRFTRVRSRCVA